MTEANWQRTAGIPNNETISVSIIEDVRTLRDGLSALIDGTPGFQCTGRFRSAEEAIEKIKDGPLHVVLVDIGLPGMSGIEVVRVLKERYPDLCLLILTVYDDDNRVFEALCAGASGYLLKKTPPARLLDSLREAVQGGAPMSPEIARRVVELFREIRPADQFDEQLTAHELRLLKLLVQGYSYKAAAASLGVSINTICFHIKKIYEKLQVHSKSEAVAKALRHRIIK
jgi:DNA-binding NarL/FixJ family response regulator